MRKIIHDIKSIPVKRREELRKHAYEAFQAGITAHSFSKEHLMRPLTQEVGGSKVVL